MYMYLRHITVFITLITAVIPVTPATPHGGILLPHLFHGLRNGRPGARHDVLAQVHAVDTVDIRAPAHAAMKCGRKQGGMLNRYTPRPPRSTVQLMPVARGDAAARSLTQNCQGRVDGENRSIPRGACQLRGVGNTGASQGAGPAI